MKFKLPINNILPNQSSLAHLFRHRLTAIAGLLLGAACILAVFWPFLFGDRTFLFCDIGSDSANATYPFYCHASLYLHQYGFSGWSAHHALGQVFDLMFYNPFSWPIILQENPAAIAKSIGVMEAVKSLTAMLLFAAFLQTAGVSRMSRFLGALTYGLSGYLILGSCWTLFSTEAVYLALLLLAVERFIQRGSLWLIPVSICLLGMAQPFYYWGFGLFTIVYLLFRRAEKRIEETTHQTPEKNTAPALVRLITESRVTLFFGAICTIGILISGVFILNSLYLMLQSPRVGGESSYTHYLLTQPVLQLASIQELLTSLYRTMSTDMLGIGSGFTGWQNYLEAPVFYCGLFILLLIPQLFILCEKRLRWLYGSVLALALFPVFFPWFRHAFWLFQGDYYRLLSLFITTTFILLGVRVLTKLESGGRLNLYLLTGTLGLIMLCLLLPPAERFVSYTIPDSNINILVPPVAAQNQLLINQPLRNMALALMLGYFLLLATWSWMNGRTQATIKCLTITAMAKCVLVVLAVLETICFAHITLNDRPVVTKKELYQKTGYNDYTVEALAFIRSNDRTTFYRINKDYSSSPTMYAGVNDAMVQDFYGSTCYFSFNQVQYIRFLNAMGALDVNKEKESRWCAGLTQRQLLQILAGTKYCLTKTPEHYRKTARGYEEIGTWGDVTAFRYRQFLPLGFAYEQIIDTKLFNSLSPTIKDATLFQAAVAEPADQPLLSALTTYTPSVTDSAPFDLITYASRLRQSAFELETYRPDRLRGNIVLDSDKLLFFSIPFDRGWSATVDGQPAKLLKVNIGFIGLIIPQGRHEVELRYRQPLMIPGLIMSACGLAAYILLLACRRWKIPCRHASHSSASI